MGQGVSGDKRSPEVNRARVAKRLAASQSFKPGEVDLFERIITDIIHGYDTSRIPRHKDFPALLRKSKAMKARIAELQAERREQVQGE